jgi:enoyl-CoA hydratase
MPGAFINAVEPVVKQIANDAGIRAVVFTAEGSENFSVGLNLKQLFPAINEMGAASWLFKRR